jgi:hypothetical protein
VRRRAPPQLTVHIEQKVQDRFGLCILGSEQGQDALAVRRNVEAGERTKVRHLLLRPESRLLRYERITLDRIGSHVNPAVRAYIKQLPIVVGPNGAGSSSVRHQPFAAGCPPLW